MYIPDHYEESDVVVLHALMRSHPLGTWVSESGGELVANHIPFLVDSLRGKYGTLFASPVYYVIVLLSINGLFWSSVISLVRDCSSPAYSADMYQCPRCGVAFEKPSFSKLMASGITCPNCKASLEIDTGFIRLKLTAAVVVLVAGVVNLLGVLNPIASKALSLVVVILSIVSAVVVIWENTNPRLRIRKKSMAQVQLNLNQPPQ